LKHRRVPARRAFAITPAHYRIAAASAAFLAVAGATGALASTSGPPPVTAEAMAAPAAQAAVVLPGLEGDPAPAQSASPSQPATPVQSAAPAQPAATGSPTNPDLAPTPAPPADKVLDYTYEGQPNSYWCGPAATRIALTVRKLYPSQDDLAGRLGTTFNGTKSANDTTRVLNDLTKTDFYRTREIPGPEATPAEMDRLQADAVRAISNGYAIVANVLGSATLADGRWLDWPGGHYITIVGYQDEGRMLKIADPANPSVSSYWITTINMASWMAQRGYSG
jgi:hypothetical protein